MCEDRSQELSLRLSRPFEQAAQVAELLKGDLKLGRKWPVLARSPGNGLLLSAPS